MSATPYFDFKDGAALDVKDVFQAITDINAKAKKPLSEDELKKLGAITDPRALLMVYATKDDTRTTFPGAGDVQLTADQAKLFGKVLTTMDDNFEKADHYEKKFLLTVAGTDGTHNLRSKELWTYLQTATQTDNGTVLEPVDKWAAKQPAHFTQEATELKSLYIETPPDFKRVVTGGFMSEKLDGAYARVKEVGGAGGHAALNVYLSRDAYEQVKDAKTDYSGPIFVMEQMKPVIDPATGNQAIDPATGKLQKKNDEPKVIYAKDVNEAQHVLASGWQKQQDFVAKNEGTYIPLTPEQYTLFQEQFKDQHNKLTVEGFAAKWNAAHPNDPQIVPVKPTGIPDGGNGKAPTALADATIPGAGNGTGDKIQVNDQTYAYQAAWESVNGNRYKTAADLHDVKNGVYDKKLDLHPHSGTEFKKETAIFDKHKAEFEALEELKSDSPDYQKGITGFYKKLYTDYQNAPAADKPLYQHVMTVYAYGQDIDKAQEGVATGKEVTFQAPNQAEFEARGKQALAFAQQAFVAQGGVVTPGQGQQTTAAGVTQLQSAHSDDAKYVLEMKQVAAWQEAMNAEAVKQGHANHQVKVDGLWGKATDALFKSEGGDLSKLPASALKLIAEMNKDGISLHPEHFEVVVKPNTPNNTPGQGQGRSGGN